MRDYSKAKIYKILNDVDDDVYVGATCQPLCVRMVEHRRARNGTFKLYKKMREVGVEHFYIELVKETPCENKEQLNAIEGEYIRKLATLNTRIEGRTKKQYVEDNREKKVEYDKQRREEKGDEINEKRRNKYNNDEEYRLQTNKLCKEHYEKHKNETEVCNICGVEFKCLQRSCHIQTKIHLKALNNDTSEKVVHERKQEYQKNYYESKKDELCVKVECQECGIMINKSSMNRHIKRKHS